MELSQPPVHAALGRGQRDAQDPGDLGDGQVGAETEGERLALVVAQGSQGVLELVAPLERLERVAGLARPGTRLDGDPLEGPRLDLAAAGPVAQAVEGDRVEPGLLPRPRRPGSRPGTGPEDLLERVGQEILAQRRVAGPVGEEPEQRLRVLVVEPLEVSVADRRMLAR